MEVAVNQCSWDLTNHITCFSYIEMNLFEMNLFYLFIKFLEGKGWWSGVRSRESIRVKEWATQGNIDGPPDVRVNIEGLPDLSVSVKATRCKC